MITHKASCEIAQQQRHQQLCIKSWKSKKNLAYRQRVSIIIRLYWGSCNNNAYFIFLLVSGCNEAKLPNVTFWLLFQESKYNSHIPKCIIKITKEKKGGMTYFMASKIRVRRDDDPLRCDDAFCLFFLESSLLMSKT